MFLERSIHHNHGHHHCLAHLSFFIAFFLPSCLLTHSSFPPSCFFFSSCLVRRPRPSAQPGGRVGRHAGAVHGRVLLSEQCGRADRVPDGRLLPVHGAECAGRVHARPVLLVHWPHERVGLLHGRLLLPGRLVQRHAARVRGRLVLPGQLVVGDRVRGGQLLPDGQPHGQHHVPGGPVLRGHGPDAAQRLLHGRLLLPRGLVRGHAGPVHARLFLPGGGGRALAVHGRVLLRLDGPRRGRRAVRVRVLLSGLLGQRHADAVHVGQLLVRGYYFFFYSCRLLF